jgi:hypothetical protein
MKKSLAVDGPFEAARRNIKTFGYNLYYNHCFTATVEELKKLEEEYAAAVEAADEELIAEKKKEIVFYEAVVNTAITAFEEEKNLMLNTGSLDD